ncbi:MAG: putative glycoside hydrolase [Chloroflexota bacterium]
MKRKSQVQRKSYSRLMIAVLPVLALILSLALAGCSIGPLDFSGATPVPTNPPGPTNTPLPPTATIPPPTPTTAPRALNGVVLDAYTNKPIANAEVTAAGILTATNSDGQFFFDDVTLNAAIEATAGGYSTAHMETGAANHIELKLRPNTVSGRVTDAKTGKPLGAVLVKLVLPAAPISSTTPLTPTAPITGTVVPPAATTPTTSTLGYGKIMAAPVQFATEVASPTQATVVTATVATNTPMPPTATPTPKPIPPTGAGFVAVYTNDDGTYFFKDVPEGASLTFKMPGYKLTKVTPDNAQKDVALEEFQVNGIYITANWASSPDLLADTLDWVKDSRINAVVVNVQNDASEWVYDTKNPDALQANNTDIFMPDMADLVKDLKSRGLYVIARIVTFQQKTMAEAKPEWSVLSSTSGKPWKGGYAAQQKWLDASNPAVQDHIISMTKEVIDLGFDEIQYDYVRFPSDPAPSESGEMVFSSGTLTDTGKVTALAGFLKKAHDVIQPTDAFMSIDVFGYSLWPDQDGEPILGVIGQDLPKLLDYTDYASPMIYPSHFSPGEQGCAKPATCAYTIVKKSGEYAQEIFAGKRAKYRPWLEAFDWPGADYTSPGSTKVPEQLQACQETGCWGWLMWDAAIDYEPRTPYKKP